MMEAHSGTHMDALGHFSLLVNRLATREAFRLDTSLEAFEGESRVHVRR